MKSGIQVRFRKANHAYFHGGVPAFGYCVDSSNMFNVNYHERKAILLIFDAVTKDMSYEDIAKCINALGYRTRKNNFFNARAIQDILRNEIYTGIFTNSNRFEISRVKVNELRIITEKEFAETKYLLRHPNSKHAAFEGNRIIKLHDEA